MTIEKQQNPPSSVPSGSSSCASSAASASSSGARYDASRRKIRYILPENAMIGSYRIEKALGRGGMGEVYLARHVKLNIYRAIKILLPSIAAKDAVYAERFMKEAKLAIYLQHPNIINVMDADYDEKYNVYYIVMEFVDGASVRKLIKTNGRFTERKALEIVLKVSEALLSAEKMKMVHRDIKPDNIMVTNKDEIKLADLGIAKSMGETTPASELTMPQVMLGTVAYVSPEQATDAQSVDCRADIYSLGVTLYEMLAAEKPYTGTQMEVLQQLFNAPVPNLQAKVPSVSNTTALLVKKMMAKSKNDRPKNFEVLCVLIQEILNNKKIVSTGFIEEAGIAPSLALKTSTSATPEKAKKHHSSGKAKITSVQKSSVDHLTRKRIAAKVTKSISIGLIFATLIFGGTYLYKTGILSQETFEELFLSVKLWATPEIMRESANPSLAVPVAVGKTVVKFSPVANSAVMEWFSRKNNKIKIKSSKFGEVNSVLPGKLTLPFGKYSLTFLIPGCDDVVVDFDSNSEHETELEIPIRPTKGKIVISCNAGNYQIWSNGQWFSAKELSVAALENYDLILKADGYRGSITKGIMLYPGTTENITVIMEKNTCNLDAYRTAKIKEATAAFEQNTSEGYSKALRLFKEEAKNKNPIASYYLGVMYESGLGMTFGWSNKNEAIFNYKKAAEFDVPMALYKMGISCEDKEAFGEALKYYQRGAEFDCIPCFIKIGDFYMAGQGGLVKNYSTAILYLTRAAATENIESQVMLGKIYASDDVMVRDLRLARKWYEKAAKAGSSEAKAQLNLLKSY